MRRGCVHLFSSEIEKIFDPGPFFPSSYITGDVAFGAGNVLTKPAFTVVANETSGAFSGIAGYQVRAAVDAAGQAIPVAAEGVGTYGSRIFVAESAAGSGSLGIKLSRVEASGASSAAAIGDAVSTLGPGWSVVAPRGLGSATGPLPPGYTTVSRWVGPEEAAAWMQNGGTAVPTGVGAGDRVYVTVLDAAKPGGTGPIRIDFAVPGKALSTAGKPEWFQMFQPMPSTPVYNVQIHVPPGTVIPR